MRGTIKLQENELSDNYNRGHMRVVGMTGELKSNDVLFGGGTPYKARPIAFITAATVWTVVVLLILLWSLEQVDQRILNSALVQARSTIEQDIRYRRWNAQHGGVYGEVSDILTPNRYLAIPDRDIVTSSGTMLTKINPAYMTRQVHELGVSESGVIGHLTSLNPVRPENKADAWEAEALNAMRTDPSLKSTVEDINGVSHLRVMLPLKAEKGCLRCHANQGYKLGDIRGGISGSVPLPPLFKDVWRERLGLTSAFGLAWLFGCATILGIYRLKTAEVSLRASEAKYRTLVETMSEGTLILDCQGMIVFASNPMGNMLERSPMHLEDKPFHDFIAENSSVDFDHVLKTCLEGDKNSFEVELCKQDDSTISTLFSPQILKHDDDTCIGLLAVVTDITDLKALELELFRRQRLSSLGLLAGGIAHEINTPVQFIKTNTSFIQSALESLAGMIPTLKDILPQIRQNDELRSKVKVLDKGIASLEEDGQLDEALEALDENIQGIKRISDIVASVKSLAGSGPVYPEVVSLNPLITKSVELTRSSWEPVANLELRLAEGLPDVQCVPRDIIQVVAILLTNAADAISDKKGTMDDASMGLITIETKEMKNRLNIQVTDDGTGISDSDIKRIFEPFYTTKDPGKGVGQGLAIAYRILEDHNGSLSVKSDPGVGAEFTVSIPV